MVRGWFVVSIGRPPRNRPAEFLAGPAKMTVVRGEGKSSEMLSFAENPPVLPPGARCVGDLAGRWWVAHTKARFEKAFAHDLLGRGVGYFLPMVERVKVSGGRKRRLMAPLFTSYVFFCGQAEDRYRALGTDRLCQVIEVADQGKLVAQLDRLHRAVVARAPLDPYPFAAVGRRCRIVGGPFAGLEGVVVRRPADAINGGNGSGSGASRTARFVLEVGILGQGATMEVDADLLEPVGEAAHAGALAHAAAVTA
jgi:transcriptional antiterminator RfaH